MRSLGETDWFGYRVEVPLTGREPVIGRLRNRLRRRGTGWGWVTVQGPSGAGITRVLQEAALLIRGEVGPEPIWIRPCIGEPIPLEPLRVALAPLLGHTDSAAGARTLQAMLSAPEAEVDTLATWLLAGASDPQVVRPSVAAARALLKRLVPGGVLIVDDYDLLDDATRRVLAPSAKHKGPGIIAGISGDAAVAPDATVWPLDPLAPAQVELLLKRWLRHTATARRLTPEMVSRYGGWPGRIIEAVRSLGRSGQLVREPRGVVVKSMPKRWPAGSRPDDAFLRWARALGATAVRLLELAALHGEPLDTGLLADAAGVKNSFVEAVREEAAASRDGALDGFLFGTEAERKAVSAALPEARRDELGRRLAKAWTRIPLEADKNACAALGRVAAYVLAGRREEAVARVESALARLDATTVRTDCDLRRLERLGALFGPPRTQAEQGPLVRLAEMLLRHGRAEPARQILRQTPDPSDLRSVWLSARLDLASGRINEAHARLTQGLPQAATGPDPVRFDAWALQARLCLQLGNTGSARAAWREAGCALSAGDIVRRATFHQGAAACAAHGGRKRAVAAHLRRAVRMLESAGHVKEAACVWARLGDVETDLGRSSEAVECLARAAHQHHVVGAADAEARARLALGRTYLGVSCYDQAAEELDAALEVAADSSLGPLLAEVHLALAAAHRGRGDLAHEREHAAFAAGLPAPAHLTLRAKSLLAAADLRAGAPGAMRLLERCEQELRAAGLTPEADEARALLFDARLRSGNMAAAAALLHDKPGSPSLRLGRARLDLVSGRDPEASVSLEHLACDPSLSIDLRTVAYAHLAEALLRQARLRESRAAAVSASALLEVQHRSRRDDLRTHRILARVFQEIGDEGRAAGHRAAARRHLRALLAAAVNPRESLRLARAQWRTDPRGAAARIA